MLASHKAGRLADFPGAPEVHVLDNQQRVITSGGAVGSLSGSRAERGGLGRYLDRLPEEYKALAAAPNFVEFKTEDGKTAKGVDAEWFIDVCHAYVEAALAGKLRADQMHLARNANVVVRATSKIGIIMLIDRATGYTPPPKDLDDAIKRIVRFEMRQWSRTWEHELAQAVAPLLGKEYDGFGPYPVWMKGIIGEVYDMLFGETAMAQIRMLCPKPGGRHTRHQHLTAEARELLRSKQSLIVGMAQTVRTLHQFKTRLRKVLLNEMLQTEMFEDDTQGSES